MLRRAALKALAVLALVLVPALTLAAPKTVKIGVLFPLTGPAAGAGAELRAAAELAASMANNGMPGVDIPMAKGGGIKSMGGARLELVVKDHEGNPTLGADLAKKLIQDDKVNVVIGCYNSAVTKTVAAVCEQFGVPMVNDSSTSPSLTRQGYKWFWRTTPHDEQFTQDLFDFMKGLSEGKAKGVAAVPMKDIQNLASACEKTEWGSSVSEQLGAFSPKYGFTMKKQLLYADKAADLSSEVRSLMAAKPDVMLFASYSADAILMMNTLKSQKASPRLVWGQNAGFEDPTFLTALGETTQGVLTRTVFLPKVASVKKVAGQVNDAYKKLTSKDMVGAASRAFTGMQAIVAILEKAGSAEPAAFQKAANTIEIPGSELVMPWKGVKFATQGPDIGQNVLGMGLIGQYQKGADGKIALEIVYPFDLATANLVYPYPGFK
jgi:branched-chain amino acid transport system substrate-binding protein